MLSKFRFIVIFVLTMVSLIGKAQSISNNGSIEFSDVVIYDEYINFNILIKNIGETHFVLYKPTLDDFCNEDIFRIYLTETSTNKRHEVFPCDFVSQLVIIHLNNTNSVYLMKGEGFFKSYKVKLKYFTPFIGKGKYSIIVSYNTSDIYFESNYDNVFKGTLISREFIVDFD